MIELLAPAGDSERLKVALLYGADAVYVGGTDYSLRANAKNFNLDDLKIGSDSSFHFLRENENNSKPLYALELNIFDPKSAPQVVQNAFKEVLDCPVKMIKKAQETPCDILGLKFNIYEKGSNNYPITIYTNSQENIEDWNNCMKSLLIILKMYRLKNSIKN